VPGRRRKTQWIDSIQSTYVTLAGAAGVGTIVSSTLLTEDELENVGGGATLIRIIGDIWTQQTAASPIVTHTVFQQPNYPGATAPVDWLEDAFQRKQMLGTYMVAPDAALTNIHTKLDLRTKRVMTQGIALTLESQNHTPAGNDSRFAFHFRMLLLLP